MKNIMTVLFLAFSMSQLPAQVIPDCYTSKSIQDIEIEVNHESVLTEVKIDSNSVDLSSLPVSMRNSIDNLPGKRLIEL